MFKNTKQRPLKRKSSFEELSESDGSCRPNRPLKRSKSENVSLVKRYLIGCAHLLFVKSDARDRDRDGNLIPPAVTLKKAYAPSSDLPQKDIVALYFDDIDRTVVSQSKSKCHTFAPPDWSLLEAYLFPWIRANKQNHVILTRIHVKHVAFRVWEVLAYEDRLIIKYDDVVGQPDNIPLGDVRGWWWDSEGDYPRNYRDWEKQEDEHVPSTHHHLNLPNIAQATIRRC